MRQHRKEAKALIEQFKSKGCINCGETAHCCLSAHHVGKKLFTIGSAVATGVPIHQLIKELKKCVCLCENCHRKVHAGLLVLPE